MNANDLGTDTGIRMVVAAFAALGAALSAAALPWSNPEMVAKAERGEIREARASWWGFDKDDSTRFLQAAITSGVSRLVVDKMPSPWIVTPIKAASNQHLVFEKGAMLLAKRGEFVGRNDWLLALDGVENVRVTGNGATLRMWREDYAHGKDGKGRDYQRGEWRHALAIIDARNVTVEGLILEDSGGDGIYISHRVSEGAAPCRDITIRDCVCDRHHRQGLSIISAVNLLVENCVFRNTKGTAPEDGVDFEPNSAVESFVNCVLRNCVSENNAGNGFEVALSHSRSSTPPCSIRFENCRSTGDSRGIKLRTNCRAAVGDWPTGTVDFVGCTFEKTRYEAVEVMQSPANAFQMTLTDCTFASIGVDDPGAPAVVLSTRYSDDPKPALPKMVNLKWPDRGNRRPYAYDSVNFASLGQGETLPLLAADTAGAEVVDKTPGEFAAGTPLRIRHHARLVVYADRPRTITVRGEQSIVARKRPPTKTPVPVTDASGKKVATVPMPGCAPSELAFDAPAAGFYALELDLGPHAFVVLGADAPFAVDCSRYGEKESPLNFIASGGTLYVPLKSGRRVEFRMKGSAPTEKVSVGIVDPDGKAVFADSALLYWTRHQASAARDGLWKWTFGRPSNMNFEDFSAEIAGARPFLFPSPDKYWHSK